MSRGACSAAPCGSSALDDTLGGAANVEAALVSASARIKQTQRGAHCVSRQIDSPICYRNEELTRLDLSAWLLSTLEGSGLCERLTSSFSDLRVRSPLRPTTAFHRIMMTPSKMTGVLAVLAAVAPLGVSAHGYMSVPKVTFATSGDPTQFCATIDGPSTLKAVNGQLFTADPESNAKAFAAAFKAQSTYKSMRALVDAKGVFQPGMDKQCGVTSATGAKQPLPAKYVEWAHSSSEGFTPSHQGPCEVWCDNTRVFQDDNCAKDYTTAPALLPYDRSKCVGASMLKIYWLALHSSTWQAYINCAPLEGGSSSGASASAGSDAATPSVTPATASASSDNEYDDEYATPAPATTAPSSSSAEEDCDDELDLAGSDEAPGSEDCDDELDLAGSDEVGADADAEVGADADSTAASGSEDCDDELDIAGSDASGSEDCDDDLSLAGSDEAAGSDSAVTTAPETTSSPATTTKAPSTTTKTPKPTKTKKTKTPKPTKTKKTKTPKPTKTKKSKTPSPTTAAPASSANEYDDEYSTPAPTPASEVGADADTEVGADADTEVGADADSAAASGSAAAADSAAASGSAAAADSAAASATASGSEDCDDELDIAGSEASGSEDCDDELDIAGSEASGSVGAEEDCDDELDIAGSEASGSEDCDDELDIAGSESAAAATTSSLNFDSLSSNDASEVGTVDAY